MLLKSRIHWPCYLYFHVYSMGVAVTGHCSNYAFMHVNSFMNERLKHHNQIIVIYNSQYSEHSSPCVSAASGAQSSQISGCLLARIDSFAAFGLFLESVCSNRGKKRISAELTFVLTLDSSRINVALSKPSVRPQQLECVHFHQRGLQPEGTTDH